MTRKHYTILLKQYLRTMTPKGYIYLHLLFSAMLFIGSTTAVARPITEDKACAMATKFYYMKVMGDQGLYYVNWGWGGHCDGYFDFDAVAANGTSYNYVQSAIVSIKPAEMGEGK